jgi:NAD(P)-dependent dehydrogenase (short-subunit alcohol dehydrogenase family)
MKQTIIITGASGKFGKILVKNFIDQNEIVIAIGRSMKSLNKINTYNKNLHFICVDLMKNGHMEKVIKKIKNLKLKPTSLINCARNLNFLKLDKSGNASSENFINEFKLGVVVPYQFTISLVKNFKNTFKNVVNIGSIYGSTAPNLKLYKNPKKDSPIQYGVSKSALEHLTKELAVRLAEYSVRVNCAAFGGLEGRVDQAFKKRYSKLSPSGKMLSESDIFGPVQMLLSNNTKGITGHTLMIDGGWTIW